MSDNTNTHGAKPKGGDHVVPRGVIDKVWGSSRAEGLSDIEKSIIRECLDERGVRKVRYESIRELLVQYSDVKRVRSSDLIRRYILKLQEGMKQ